MESAILALALTVVRSVVKNPRKKAQLKKLLLQVRDAIDAAFGSD